ncbi:MAG: aminopeptidase [Bacteroidaceae bacterium]|nr:aminopeptidase [Bacteroidaceae bacterium]
MKKIILSLVALLAVSGTSVAQKAEQKVDTVKFTVVKENPITSIKNQNRSGTCWNYSSLSFFEAELLRLGKGAYNLSESFVCQKTYMDRADKTIRTHGDASFAQGGSFYDVLYCLKNYGIVPEGILPYPITCYGDSLYNFNEMWPMAEGIVNGIAKSDKKKINVHWRETLQSVLDGYFGKVPASFEYKGKVYTPETFCKSLGLNLDDYVSLTSFSHQPKYGQFAIEVQDNWRWGLSYNLPLDEFMEVMESAVRNGYTFALGADFSETYFSRSNSVVQLPAKFRESGNAGSDAARWTGKNTTLTNQPVAETGEAAVTPEMRQLAYDNWETTDDHGMVIYGLAKNPEGKEYFMVKNSWGEYGPYKGIFYVSKPYVAYKTLNILINKNAIPKHIRKHLGL